MKYLLLLLAVWFLAFENSHAGCPSPKPTGLQVTTQTSCSATLTWDSSPGVGHYIFWYKMTGGIPTTVNVGTVTNYTIGGLLSNTQYQYKVAACCNNGTSKGYSKVLESKTLKCSGVANLSVSSIAGASATVSWQPLCSASSFKVRYRSTSPLSSWTVSQNIFTFSSTLLLLTPATSYEVQAAGVCGNDNSPWSSSVFFQTLESVVSPHQPNILLILEDDGRYDAFGPTGGPSFFQTPAINRIANEGVNFKYMLPATSQCTPSRCTIYTGLYPHKHGATTNGGVMDITLPIIQQILRDNGYYTGFVGKYGQNGPPLGFDWYAKSTSLSYLDPTFSVNGTDFTSTGEHYTDVIQKYALRFLDSVPQDKPFMLMYFTIVPHNPTVPRPQEASLYTNDVMPFPTNFQPYAQNYPSYLYGLGTSWTSDTLATDSLRRIEFETTKGLDYSVDTLFQYLQAKGILNKTVIIFTSDNGYLKGEHLLGGKQIAYEESIRLPLFIRYPKWFSAATLINDEIASNLDIAPTILEAAGIPDTFHMDGISLHQLYTHSAGRKDFLYEMAEGDGLPAIRAVRGLQYKYIRSWCNSSTAEFYNLLSDPKEDTNQIFNPAYASLIQTYANKLDSLRSAFSDVNLSLMSCHMNYRNLLRENDDDSANFQSSVVLFPNPAETSFDIFLPETCINEKIQAQVFDLSGRMITSNSWIGNTFKFYCNKWPAGSYLVKANFNGTTCFSKLSVIDH